MRVNCGSLGICLSYKTLTVALSRAQTLDQQALQGYDLATMKNLRYKLVFDS